MKKRHFLCTLLLLFISEGFLGQQVRTHFGPNEILEDLDYLYHSLIDAHYDLYSYVSKDAFYKNYTHVKNTVPKDSISLLEATNLFQRVIAAANNGHTEIDFPGASYRDYAYGGGTVFPLEVAFENNKSLVRKNFSNHSEIKIGDEIIGINGFSMETILNKIYPQVSAERPSFKNAKIEMYSFPRYYWQVFGKQDAFEVEILSNGIITNYHLKAIEVIEGYEMKRTEVMNAHMLFRLYDRAAYLNPGDFSGDEEKYQRFIDSAFAAINTKKAENLIIDLRNNRGGNNSFSDYLVSYIADKPFKWCSAFTVKTSRFLKEHTRKNNDTTKAYFKAILTHKNGTTYAPTFNFYLPQEAAKRFKGTVYVLVNRQSHSQSAVTAAQIQDNNFGIIVGEETAEYASLYASQFQYPLPHTGIPVKVAKGYIIRVNGSTTEEGVLPDIVIKDHLLDENDEIVTGLLQKLN